MPQHFVDLQLQLCRNCGSLPRATATGLATVIQLASASSDESDDNNNYDDAWSNASHRENGTYSRACYLTMNEAFRAAFRRLRFRGNLSVAEPTLLIALSEREAKFIESPTVQALFRRGTETVVDTTASDTFGINPDRFSSKNSA